MPRIGATWVKYGDFDFFSSPISVNRQKGENGSCLGHHREHEYTGWTEAADCKGGVARYAA
jgi:hypothetical protein